MAAGKRPGISALLRETRYRSHFLRSDSRVSIVLLLVFTLLNPVFVFNDIAFIADPALRNALFVFRALFTAACIAALWIFWKSKRALWHDLTSSMWLAILVVFLGFVLYTRLLAGKLVSQAITITAIIALLCFAMRGPALPRILASAILLLVETTAMLAAPADGNGPLYLNLFLCGLGIGVTGTASTVRSESTRRNMYFLQLSERRNRRELQKEKERVEALSRAKSSFLAAMSHEFRTPMNAIMGLSRLLSDSLEEKETQRYATIIHESAQALLVNLNDILDFSRMDAGHLDLSPASFSVRRLTASVIELLEPQAARRGLQIESTVSAATPDYVLADPFRLRQILLNLLSNAIKFTESGKIRVSVDAGPGPDGQLRLQMEVADTGIGMSVEMLSRLFQPFEQAAAGAKKIEGTGLGLAISKRLVTGMGGQIDVESSPAGSVFRFSIRAEPASAPPDSIEAGTRQSTDLSILLVEDDQTNQLVAAAMLKRIGCKADLAASGGEAMDAVSRKRYDVILLDRQLPDMDGIDVARWIRMAEEPHPFVIAVSASTLPEEIASFRNAGIDDFVSKPIDLDELSAALDRSALKTNR